MYDNNFYTTNKRFSSHTSQSNLPDHTICKERQASTIPSTFFIRNQTWFFFISIYWKMFYLFKSDSMPHENEIQIHSYRQFFAKRVHEEEKEEEDREIFCYVWKGSKSMTAHSTSLQVALLKRWTLNLKFIKITDHCFANVYFVFNEIPFRNDSFHN